MFRFRRSWTSKSMIKFYKSTCENNPNNNLDASIYNKLQFKFSHTDSILKVQLLKVPVKSSLICGCTCWPWSWADVIKLCSSILTFPCIPIFRTITDFFDVSIARAFDIEEKSQSRRFLLYLSILPAFLWPVLEAIIEFENPFPFSTVMWLTLMQWLVYLFESFTFFG